jgi:hypothetical protein
MDEIQKKESIIIYIIYIFMPTWNIHIAKVLRTHVETVCIPVQTTPLQSRSFIYGLKFRFVIM